jgi:phosphatidylserine decarboxylase
MRWLFGHSSAFTSYLRFYCSKALWFSRFFGWIMHLPFSKRWIDTFVKQHQIDLSEFEIPDKGWIHFDAFFSRKLRPGARVFNRDKTIALMPADARYRRLETDLCSPISIKNQNWNLNELLGPLVLSPQSQTPSHFNGALLARLCPTDYHRFHSPVKATIGRIISMGERLHSVNPWNLNLYPELLSENKRVAIELLTEEGRWIVVAIGATWVGSIELSVQTGDTVEAADEMGAFHFGGSSLVIVHESPLWQEADDLKLLWTQHPDLEILARMGEPMKINRL